MPYESGNCVAASLQPPQGLTLPSSMPAIHDCTTPCGGLLFGVKLKYCAHSMIAKPSIGWVPSCDCLLLSMWCWLSHISIFTQPLLLRSSLVARSHFYSHVCNIGKRNAFPGKAGFGHLCFNKLGVGDGYAAVWI